MTDPAPRPTGAARFDLTPFERWEAVTLDDVHVGFLHRVLEDGVLTTWLLDSRSGRQLGMRSTGHAGRGT